jgi:D-alanine-D-alanine ligase
VRHLTFLRADWQKDRKRVRKEIEKKLNYPVFVKPANLGSSVGVSKARDRKELEKAMDEAAAYDRKIIVEEGVGGKDRKAREIECSVLGNDRPEASIAGEVIPCKEFYDYEAKYLTEGSELLIPAKLSKKQMQQVQEMAVQAFLAVDCAGMARVDFLMDPKTEKIYVNEVNTIPGFTAISMYPKLWAASGLPYPKLIERLIQLALERHGEKKKTKFSR